MSMEGADGQRVPETVKCAALEAVAANLAVDRETREILLSLGIQGHEKHVARDRPWGEADDVEVRRLATARGWSSAAIAVFLHRSEDQISHSLGRAHPPAAGA